MPGGRGLGLARRASDPFPLGPLCCTMKPMPAPARKGFRSSWLGRAARAVVGEPERPRPRTWPDVLGAALLIPLGVSAAVTGFVFRHARWEHYLIFEGLALA